jgi:4-hydroxybenzoate polyprenyltransferase
VTQYLLQHAVILPLFYATGSSPALTDFQFLLLVIDTLLIAASGYVINDIIDEETDRFNGKVKKGFIDKKAKYWYSILVLLSMIIALYIALAIDHIALFLLNPIAIILLYLYSKYFKKMPLIGNLVIGVFCAFVTGILWFAEREAYFQMSNKSNVLQDFLSTTLIAYMTFGFIITVYREIVKDIEDLDGDKAANYNTVPISLGIPRSRYLAMFYGITLLILEILWLYFDPLQLNTSSHYFFGILIIIPTIISLLWFYKSRTTKDYWLTSQIIKVIMALGLIYIVFINIS